MKNEMDDLLNAVFGSRRTLAGTNASDETQKPSSTPAHSSADDPIAALFADKPPADSAPAQTDRGHKIVASSPKQPSNAPTSGLGDTLRSAHVLQQNVVEMSSALGERLAAQSREIAMLDSFSPLGQSPAPATEEAAQACLSDAAFAAQHAALSQLSQTARDDIARIRREVNTPAVQNLSTAHACAAVAPGTVGAGAEAFVGLPAALGETVFGQTDYLQSLCIAFKRPYVMGHTGTAARGCILVTGKPCTGRRLSLTQMAQALKARSVLASEAIVFIDLSLYPTPTEEKLFLQDLYMALSCAAELLVFTHYETCHTGFVNVLRALVQTGKSPLSARYVLQNGRLIDVGSALVQDAVSELTPRGKYLIFFTEQPVAKIADRLGAPFVNALTDVCETAPLSPDALLQIARAQYTKLQARAEAALQYSVSAQDTVLQLGANAAGVTGGASGVLSYFDTLYRALAQYKLLHDSCETCAALRTENGKITVCFDAGQPMDLLSLITVDYTGELEAVKAELGEIVGLTKIKDYVLSLEDNFKAQTRRKEQGLKTAAVSMHMIFTGNPGTGKTTIARLISRYLKAIGVLSGGQLVEVTRADLVGKYVGHTAPLTTQVLRSAIGGVLFIDEAYSLYRGGEDSFGLEAIDTLVKGIEDNRDNLIVILAGYSYEMAEFLTSNSGLKSRFPNLIEFPDYSGAQLLSITKLQAKSKGYTLDDACDNVLLAYFNAVQLTRAGDAGNGRLARNKVEEAILNQSKRLLHEPQADLSLLTTQDFALNDINTGTQAHGG